MESAAAQRGPTRSVLSAEAERFPHLAEVIPHAGAIDRDAPVIVLRAPGGVEAVRAADGRPVGDPG